MWVLFVFLKKHNHNKTNKKQGGAYLEGILSADVILRSHRWNDIAGQRDTPQDWLLSAVCRETKREGERVSGWGSEWEEQGERKGGREADYQVEDGVKIWKL